MIIYDELLLISIRFSSFPFLFERAPFSTMRKPALRTCFWYTPERHVASVAKRPTLRELLGNKRKNRP